jgi:hypothetical protein
LEGEKFVSDKAKKFPGKRNEVAKSNGRGADDRAPSAKDAATGTNEIRHTSPVFEEICERIKTSGNSVDKMSLEGIKLPEFYYDDRTATTIFWLRTTDGEFARMSEMALRRHLKLARFGINKDGGRDIDRLINECQMTRRVAYAGPLAGHRVGAFDGEGGRVLVTKPPTLITPAAGDWRLLQQIIDGMLIDDAGDQRPYLFGWYKFGLECLYSGHNYPGQMMVIAGEADSGKTLLQDITTALFGGRTGKPYQSMTDRTQFNSDLFGAEHLRIDDEAASTDLRARRHFGAILKQITASNTQRWHGKNKDALMLSPFWRLMTSLNDEDENLMVLPPLDESLQDKIILLRARRHPMPMPADSPAQKIEFWRCLQREFPAFIYFLLNWTVPKALRSKRYGITHYHHPALLQALQDMAPEMRLWSLINDPEHFFSDDVRSWSGTSTELERLFEGSHLTSKLFTWSNACGVYLGRLAKKFPARVSSHRKHDQSTIWTIKAG